jgi:hypothetical protein
MGYRKYSSFLGTCSIALFAALAPFSLVTLQSEAQPIYVSVAFPRTTVGSPRRAIGGGTRGPIQACVIGASPLTVLSPHSNVATTVSAQPTLYWYIPRTQAKVADFLVYDEQGQIVYQTPIALKGIPGVVKLNFPKSLALEIGQEYDWKLALRCNSKDEVENVAVGGTIKRTALTSTQKAQLAAAKQPLKQAEVYAKAGVWQETIGIVAQLRHDRPSDRNINAAWKELLESVGLKDMHH